MATEETEAPKPAPAGGLSSKLVLIFAGGALLMSIVNTVLIAMNPTAGKVEQFNEALKGEVTESISGLEKKIDGLKSAEMEWQKVLKKSSEKPDAVYKVQRSDAGISLVEIQQEAH